MPQLAGLHVVVRFRRRTIPLYICCLASWDSASLMPLARASGITLPDQRRLLLARHSGYRPKLPLKRPSAVTKEAASTSCAAGASDRRQNANLSPGASHQTCGSNLGCGPKAHDRDHRQMHLQGMTGQRRVLPDRSVQVHRR